MRWDEVLWVEVRWGEMKSLEVRWDEVRWGAMRWGEVRWDEVSWGEVKSRIIIDFFILVFSMKPTKKSNGSTLLPLVDSYEVLWGVSFSRSHFPFYCTQLMLGASTLVYKISTHFATTPFINKIIYRWGRSYSKKHKHRWRGTGNIERKKSLLLHKKVLIWQDNHSGLVADHLYYTPLCVSVLICGLKGQALGRDSQLDHAAPADSLLSSTVYSSPTGMVGVKNFD